jgi:hypothetical protein
MPIEVLRDGAKLIFRDYLNRKVTILYEDYSASSDRQSALFSKGFVIQYLAMAKEFAKGLCGFVSLMQLV